MHAIFRLIPVVLLLAACAGPQVTPEQPRSAEEAAYQALESGDYHAAARRFAQLADSASPPLREEYLLRSVEALIQAGQENQAEQVLQGIPAAGLGPDLTMLRQLLSASLRLADDPDAALAQLVAPAAPEAATELHARYHHLRARAYSELGNHLDAAREYIQRELFLTDPQAIEANQLAIWEALSNLPNESLAELRVQPPPDVLSGWMELAQFAKAIDRPAGQLADDIAAWRVRYPTHPALPSFLDALQAKSKELVTRPTQIGVLLPFSGRFEQAAEAVRDGILAGHYASPLRNEVTLRFYDERGPSEVAEVYRTAVADGAELIIGPLDKEAVRTLTHYSELPVATVALNYAGPALSPALFQFSLAPEGEARQAAELAWLDAHNNAAVLVPSGPWGGRIASAFVERWEELGGRVVAQAEYDGQKSDHSQPLKRLLSLNESESRRRLVQDIIGRKVDFETRRRGDVDFVFLAASPRQAQLIRPQLRFHRAIGLPVYATSHVFAGQPDTPQDRDLDGIIFGDMPWILGTETPYATLRRQTAEPFKHYPTSLQRLMAMGVDAYHLVPRLKLLDKYPSDRFQGETGTLHVDANNRVRRQLVWAHFRRGEVRILTDGRMPEEVDAGRP